MKPNSVQLVIVVLFTVVSTGRASSKLHLDEVMEDIVEQLFGRAVQEEFEEITQNCPKALTEIKKAGHCITDRNISYARLNHPYVDAVYTKQLCDDLLPVGKCLESVIEALKSCVGDREVQRRSLETVRAGMDAGLQYFCKDRGAKMNQLFKEGFPQCFIRRPGRMLARCFPARSGHLNERPNYWGDLESDYFFNPLNCQLLRNHTQCAVYVLGQCQDATRGVRVFQGAIDTVMDELGCSDVNELQSRGGSALVLPSPLLLFSAVLFFATRLPIVGLSLKRLL